MPSHVARFGLAMLALVLAVSVAMPRTARADELQDFELARNAYESQNYPLSVARFEALVGGAVPRLQTRALVLESRKYLAASYLFRAGEGDRQRAESQFEALLREDGSYELDPIAFPTEILDVFTAVRSRIREQIEAEQAARRRAEEERLRREAEARLLRQRRMDTLLRLAATETVERRNSRIVATIPFGIGQFQNGDLALGLTFAIAETLLTATTVISYLIHQSIPVDPADRASVADAELASRLTNQISFAVLLATVAGGILQAHLAFVPQTQRTRPRPLPAELREGLEVSVGPAGFRLEF